MAIDSVEADPKKPYKSYVAILVAMLTTLAGYSQVLPAWATLVIAVVLSGLGVYLVPNPLRFKYKA